MAAEAPAVVVRRIGEYLPVAPEEIQAALQRQKSQAIRSRIGDVLIAMRAATRDEVLRALYSQRVDRLRTCSLFSTLTSEELSRLVPLVTEISLEDGQVLMEQETIGDSLYVLASGTVAVFRRVDEEELPLHVMKVGETIGEMGYFSDGTRSASAKSLGRSELLLLKYADLPACFALVPNLATEFLEIVTRRLRETNVHYQANYYERRAAERALQNLSAYLDMSASMALGLGIEALIDRIVSTASKVLEAERATLFLLDPATGELWSKVAEGEDVREIRIPPGTGIAGWVAQYGQILHIPDAYADERFNRAIDQRTGFHTKNILAGPVRNMDGQVIGVVQVINRRREHFTPADETLFNAFVYHAAIAVENFSLYRRVMASHHKLAVMLDVATFVSQTLDIGALISRIVAKICEILHCDRASFFVLDRESNELWSMEAHGSSMKEIRFPASAGLAGHTARTGEVLNIFDAYEDARFNPEIDRKTGYRTRSVLCVPVLDREYRTVGVAQAINRPGGFSSEDIDLLRAMAAQIGIAMENAQLYARTVSMKNYLQSVQESITDGIVTLDNRWNLVTANRAAASLLELGPQSIRHDFRHLVGPGNETLLALLEQVYLIRRSVLDRGVALELPSGRQCTVNIHAQPLKDHEGQHQGLVLMLEDVTREKKVENALSRMMPREIVREIIHAEATQNLGGVRRKATVLFSDIREFSSIAEKLSAEQTMDFLNQYFTVMVAEVFAQRGAVDKFIGDALMALFGVFLPQPDDAQRAIRAALGMSRALDLFNQHRSASGLRPVRMGVGINTAEVVSGYMGSRDMMNYTVVGDGVNVAARLESLNRQYDSQILISESTRAELGDHFVFRPLDDVIVKGKTRPVTIFEVLGERGHRLTPAHDAFTHGLAAYHSRQFSRARELFLKGADSDGPCRVFATRCQHFLDHPPPDDWDGVWRATTK